MISRLAKQEPRWFYLRGSSDIDDVCRRMITAVADRDINSLKLKTLELLKLLSDPELLQKNDIPVYLSRKNNQLAKDVRKRITDDLSCHVTLRQLS